MAQSKFTYLRKSITYVLGRFVFNLKYMTASAPKYGLKLKFRTQDGGGRAIYKKGLYEERLTNYFVHRLDLREGDIVFDVGANIGWYSNIFATQFDRVEVHAFEPDPENYKVLVENLRKNNADRVIVNNIGVGERSETKKLFLYKESNIGRHSMLDINEGPSIDVEITSFDDYVTQKQLDYTRIKFLKIDIEGFEYSAFKGGVEFLKHVPTIMAEFSPGYMRKGGVEPADLLKLLRSYGFVPHVIRDLELDSIDDESLLSRDTNINLLWKKG